MLALLHTSPVHVPVFDALRDRQRPGLTLRHTVAPELLDRARREGPGTVADEIAEVVRRAADEGAGAVLCTCSTLGAVAETVPAAVPVLRIDRPMAEAAVARAGDGRITVAAALASTLGPTADLVTEAARRAGHRPWITTLLVPGAWDLFEAGDTDGYHRAVAAALTPLTGADAVVLAQASMEPVRALLPAEPPVFASPGPGFAAAALAATGESGPPNG
ncbi:aspartate/glutamate racemase family protein [Streptomyces albidoflavus]|uniref:arylsulfatase n=1 Tax=Streptomyces albidoflavus TaxID=1886 RepID=UPI0030873CB1|nr:aspartate/glutamate racemase family protein [Streptomyces albidoflavus]